MLRLDIEFNVCFLQGAAEAVDATGTGGAAKESGRAAHER